MNEKMDDLRILMRARGIPYWKVAEKIGISEMTLYRWLRIHDADHRKKIMDAINELSEGEKKVDDLRILMRARGIPYWKVAEKIGVSEMSLYRWLRIHDADHRKKIMDAINELSEGKAVDEIN